MYKKYSRKILILTAPLLLIMLPQVNFGQQTPSSAHSKISFVTEAQAGSHSRPACFSSLPKEAVALETSFGRDDNAARQWRFILLALRCYRENSRDLVASAAFSHNLKELSELSYAQRKEAGGFAGGFVRDAFLKVAINIVENWDFWRVPLTEAQLRVGIEKVNACVLTSAVIGAATDEDPFVVTLAAAGVCGEMALILASEAAGDNHFEQHLTPAFRDHIRREFAKTIAKSTPVQIGRNLQMLMDDISKEHELQFEKALVPAIEKVDELPEPVRAAATEMIPRRARELRFTTFRLVLGELEDQGLLKAMTVDALIRGLPDQPPIVRSTSGRVFQVADKTNTGMTVKIGDTVSISATGRIIVGMFAGATGPDGIEGYENYSVIVKAKHGALMARVVNKGNEGWRVVGARDSFTAANGGVLEFMVNDADTSNNQGQFAVTVNITPGKR